MQLLKKITPLFVSIFILQNVSAQKNLKSASLITLDGKEINGFVNDKETYATPASFSFKSNEETNFKTYKPEQIREITIEQKNRYVSAIVNLDQTQQDIDVSNPADSSSYVKTLVQVPIFLQAELISSKMSLYAYIDHKTHFFVKKGDGSFTELIYRKYKTTLNDGSYREKEDNIYVRQLQFLFDDCTDVAQNMIDLHYTASSISRLINNYNTQCPPASATIFLHKTEGLRFQFGLIAGVSSSSLKITPNGENLGSTLIFNQNFTGTTTLAFGIRLKGILPGQQQKISLLADVFYSQYKGQVQKQVNYVSSNFYTNRKIELAFSMINTNLLVNYDFKKSAIWSPHINAGLGFSLTNLTNSDNTTSEYLNGTTTVRVAPAFGSGSGIKKLNPSIVIGAGFNVKQFVIDYRLNILSNTSASSNYKIPVMNHSLLLGYNF
jgi:hypothetical protein